MANKRRKMFPTSPANQTVDCPDICDPTCPYGCYPFPDFDSLPPPPPPRDVTNKGQHVSPYLILIVSLVASLFLLVSCYVIIIKYCSGCSRFRRRSPRSSTEPDDDLINEIHGPAIDHPFWYIRTVGLQSSVINSITIFKYKKGENLVEGTNCSVCLNEFQEDETLRLLPKCNHAFHIPCIDTWLRSHTNCPLCRAGIVPNVGSDAGFSPNDTNSSVLVVNDDTQVEDSGNGGELGVNLVTDVEVCENRGSTGDGIEIPLFDDERREIGGFKADLDSNGNGVFGAIGNSCENDTIQTMRRSYSVDLDSIADVVIDFGSRKSEGSSGNPKVDGLNDEIRASYLGQSRVFSKMVGSSIEESLHKRPVPMKRSFSCGGRSFLSRQYRSHNAILPL